MFYAHNMQDMWQIMSIFAWISCQMPEMCVQATMLVGVHSTDIDSCQVWPTHQGIMAGWGVHHIGTCVSDPAVCEVSDEYFVN